MNKCLSTLFTLCFPALFSLPASATVILKMELPELVGRSDVIFVGQVAQIQSHWNEGRRHIVTDTTFKVEQLVKGKTLLTEVVVRNLGGTVDGLGMWVSGSPTFKQGERAVIFTDQRDKHRYVTGMQQGVYRIVLDAATKIPRVRARINGLALAKRKGGSLELLRPTPVEPRPLKNFIGDIKQLISICAEDQSRCNAK